MLEDLSLRAKKLLAAQYRQLLTDKSVVVGSSAALLEVLAWCDELEFEPGKWLKTNKVYRFDRQYIAQINQILVEDGFASIFDNFYADNHQSAAQRNPNEKQAKRKPTHHLVLAAITHGAVLDVAQTSFYSTPQINLELDITQLNLTVFDSLIVIENRDSFNDWHKFKVTIDLTKALVVYRGDKHHSTACKTLLESWRTRYENKPTIYFGDLDLAGLRIAISAGYSYLLLPQLNWLVEETIKQHYPLEQDKYLKRLEQDCPTGWDVLFKLIKDNRAGLRQQKMYNIMLMLYPS